MASLLLGAGNSRDKKIALKSAPDWSLPLVTLDMGDNCGADVVWDLEQRPLPFLDEEFDELGAYDVLEHIGRQGDWRGYFDEMAEYWRILKPGGIFGVLVPQGCDANADPGHTRFFGSNWFAMLDQAYYERCKAAGTAFTDYRWYWKHSFECLTIQDVGGHHIAAILRKA